MILESVENNKKIIRLWIDGFVDDTSMFIQLDFGDNNIAKLIEYAKNDGQNREGLLHTTVGK
jgi:hypothetical protein